MSDIAQNSTTEDSLEHPFADKARRVGIGIGSHSFVPPFTSTALFPYAVTGGTGEAGLWPLVCRKASPFWDYWTVEEGDVPSFLRRSLVVDIPEAQTEPELGQEEIERATERLFETAKDEHFEDGMESAFSRRLISLIETYCEPMKELLAYWLVREKADPYVVSEALRWIGHMDHPISHRFRRWLLERCLKSPSSIVRDGAALGLAAMDDSEAIPSLREAIENEACDELRMNLEQVLAQFGV